MKKLWLAILLTFIFPGAGQLYFGFKKKGAWLMVGYAISLALTPFLIGLITLPIIFVYSMVDIFQANNKQVVHDE